MGLRGDLCPLTLPWGNCVEDTPRYSVVLPMWWSHHEIPVPSSPLNPECLIYKLFENVQGCRIVRFLRRGWDVFNVADGAIFIYHKNRPAVEAYFFDMRAIGGAKVHIEIIGKHLSVDGIVCATPAFLRKWQGRH